MGAGATPAQKANARRRLDRSTAKTLSELKTAGKIQRFTRHGVCNFSLCISEPPVCISTRYIQASNGEGCLLILVDVDGQHDWGDLAQRLGLKG